MDRQAIVTHWSNSAATDAVAMRHLYESGDYAWSLFIGHLVVEKLLKAYYVKMRGEEAPLIHNLLRLARLSGLELNADQTNALATITAFNLEARYDDHKREFYRRCTQTYAKNWLAEIGELDKWIRSML